MKTDKPEAAAFGARLGCGALAVVGVLGFCFWSIAVPQILGEPPAFHNTVFRSDHMFFHRWETEGPDEDGLGAAIMVDMHREYVLVFLGGGQMPSPSVISTNGLEYSLEWGTRSVSGKVTNRTLVVVDVRTGARTGTPLGPGDAFEWLAAERRAHFGGDPKPDFRAMLTERKIPIPGAPPSSTLNPTSSP